jgi:hypothetical protein
MTTLETIRVGDIIVHPIYDGTAVLTTDMWAGSDWTAHRHLLDDANRLVVPVGAFLVRVDDKLLLLDAGVQSRTEPLRRRDGGPELGQSAARRVEVLAHLSEVFARRIETLANQAELRSDAA